MDNQYRTIFSGRNDDRFRSLANVGKSSLAGSLDYIPAGNGFGGGKALPATKDSNLVTKFFDGDDKPDMTADATMTDRFRHEKMPQGLPSGQAPFTDSMTRSKASYAYDLHRQVQEKSLRKKRDIESDRKADFQMLKERYENDPYGKQGAGAPILDEYGKIMTTRKKPAFQSHRPYHFMNSLDSARFSTMSTNAGSENVDYDLVPIKPHNPYINRINTSHTLLPEFAIKHQLNHELGPRDQFLMGSTQNTFSQPQQVIQPHPAFQQQQVYQPPQNYAAPEHQDHTSMNMIPMANQNFSNQPGTFNINGSQIPYTVDINSLQMPQQPVYTAQIPSPVLMQTNNFGSSPLLTNRLRTPATIDFARMTVFPQANTINEGLEKTRKLQSELDLQKELVVQIEEKKKREEGEKRNKKLQEILDEERIRRENEEFERLYGVKYLKLEPRNLNLSIASELDKSKMRDKTHVEFYTSQDVLKLSPGKSSVKRPRTPIEEVERRLRLEELDRQRMDVSQQIVRDLPNEVQKQISKTISDELRNMRVGFITEQQNLTDQIVTLRQQALVANKERILSQKEIDELKYKLKEQQLREEIRQGELYRALVKHNQPTVIYSNTYIDPNAEDEVYKLNTKPRNKGYWKNLAEKRDHDINAEVRSNSELLSVTKRGTVLGPDNDTNYGYSSANDSLNYLKYFDSTSNGLGIKMNSNLGKYKMPDNPDNLENLVTYPLGDDEMADNAVRLLRKNKDRLALLEEMENTETDKIDKLLGANVDFGEGVKLIQRDWGSDEGAQELRQRYGNDYSDALIEKINNPRGLPV